jgi:hypothetical protein
MENSNKFKEGDTVRFKFQGKDVVGKVIQIKSYRAYTIEHNGI